MRNVDSTGWDRSMLIIVIEIIFIMNKFLLVSRRARWFIFRNIHCKWNVSVLYQVSATTSKKCFKQNTQVESETWKPKKRNSYKRLISFALTLSTFFVCSIHEFLQANLWMGAFLTNTMSSRHCRLMNIFFWRTPFCFWWFTINQIRLNFCYEIFFCFERRLKWPIWFWNHKIISKRVGCEKFHTSNLNVNDTANYAKNTFISLWTKTKSTDLLMEK